ncbi:hypothetical protein JANAI62_21530 [Jannaschia pagri]|uniref:DUF5666 domain-containing protein n=1 Tax=Jannaschia pagri TaxID=2829797 RepID=A0ABQ4NM96_9RHOB|nr:MULTISPECIES: DUF5666 domain-containing protein [unclassified Jannaschia]GIT91696.1 hypothetical protein JANAI61_21540 [Jannaschia sp. AI_61]GIT95530.1 hypothetical protein JANAI62_21530 [Jannaschia sp. AI_62]
MTTSKFTRRTCVFGGGAAALLPGVGWTQEREIEGGIGGTGIVGIATEVGGLVVAGRALTTDDGTRITDAFGALPAAALTRGDSLTVEAAGSVGSLVARRIHVTQPVVGTVTAASARQVTVNGVTVTLDSGLRSVRPGSRVAVSGLWRGTEVIASRLSPARSPLDLVSGDVSRGQGATRIGAVPVARLPGRPPSGSFATAFGRYDPARGLFQVQQSETGRFTGAAGRLRRLAVEGFLEPSNAAPGFRISGLGHSFARNLNLSNLAQGRALFSGAYRGTFAADQALPLPEDTRRRAAILGALASRS